MSEIFSRVLPILVLVGLGVGLKSLEYLCEKTMKGFKKIVLNICLPATLFMTFLEIELKYDYIFLVLLMIGLLSAFYLIGLILNKARYKEPCTMRPFFYTGFSFGMLGIPLFIIMFGKEHLGVFSMLGLGHEIFVWMIYFPLLTNKLGSLEEKERFIVQMLKSPIIVSIFLGLLLNMLGLTNNILEGTLTSGLVETLRYLSLINTPIILISLGYGIEFDRTYLLQSLEIVVMRLLLL